MNLKTLVLIVLAMFVLLLTACQTYPFAPANPPPPPACEELVQQEERPENFPFDTIVRDVAPGYWPEDGPTLLVLTASDEIAEIAPYIRKEEAVALREVNFDTTLVMAAFSGLKSRGGWGFCITSITQQDRDILLHTHLIEGPVASAALASYYHLLRLPRKQLPTGEATFALALTAHQYVITRGQPMLEASPEKIVTSVTRSLP